MTISKRPVVYTNVFQFCKLDMVKCAQKCDNSICFISDLKITFPQCLCQNNKRMDEVENSKKEKEEEADVEEESSKEICKTDVHVITLLLERAPWDLAVEAFLVRVFLCLPRHLKTCRRVCSAWNIFIKEQV